MKAIQAILFSIAIIICRQTALAQDCALSCPSNIIIKAENGKEGTVISFPEIIAANCGPITFTPASGSFFRLGSHSIIASTSAGQKCSFTVTVTDNNPPGLSPLVLSRNTIWPATGKLRKVSVDYTATDNSEKVKTVLSVTSNATDGEKDFEIVNEHLVRLKASRLADDSPRIFYITVTATDESGNKATRTTSIAVSKTMMAEPAK